MSTDAILNYTLIFNNCKLTLTKLFIYAIIRQKASMEVLSIQYCLQHLRTKAFTLQKNINKEDKHQTANLNTTDLRSTFLVIPRHYNKPTRLIISHKKKNNLQLIQELGEAPPNMAETLNKSTAYGILA